MGYSFTITSQPTQCQPLSILVSGGGTPPYRLLLTPIGPSSTDNEVRKIVDVTFSDSQFTLDKLAFPGNTEFIATVSDAKGVGTGGTSIGTKVSPSDDSSCLPSGILPNFYIFLDPQTLSQCEPVKIAWNNSVVQRPVSIWGIIPGGESFEVPLGDAATSGESANWTVNVRAGTTVSFVAGDARGMGSGGSSSFQAIGAGSSDSCLNDSSPSSTAGPPAGTVSPTPLVTASAPDVKTIVGAVVGSVAGLVLIIIFALYMWRRNRRTRLERDRMSKEVDLLQGMPVAPVAGATSAAPAGQAASEAPSDGAAFLRPEMRTRTSSSNRQSSGSGNHSPSSVGNRLSSVPSVQDARERRSSFGTLLSPVPTSTWGGESHTDAHSASSRGDRKAPLTPLQATSALDDEDGPTGGGSGLGPQVIEVPPSYERVRRASALPPEVPGP